MASGGKTFVIALGGNSIIRSGQRGTFEEQYGNLVQAANELLELFANDHRIVVTHGNGPQVGNLLLAMDTACEMVPPMSLDLCVAATQGSIGSMIQLALANSLKKAGLKHNITSVISLVIVDRDDPAFKNPTKPVGSFYTATDAEKFRREKGWTMVEDSARGFRRVVPSPVPLQIQQSRIIRTMMDSGEIVISLGGGGIPVVREEDGSLCAVEAVIDKDLASSRLAVEINADVLLILTAVEKVYLNFESRRPVPLDHLDLSRATRLLESGQFAKGSMEPKIRAGIEFLRNGGPSESPFSSGRKMVLITAPGRLLSALRGNTGTCIEI